MKERERSAEASGWDGTPQAGLTPLDVQQKEFRVARFGAGYRMREVDEFLDQVTDALSALVAENERLQRTAGAGSPVAPSVAPVSSDGDRAAVAAFLRTEKGFLQDLGTLVQSHAEELKTMVRSARRETAAAPAEAAAAVEAVEAEPVAPDRPPADVEAASPPGAIASEPVDEPAMAAPLVAEDAEEETVAIAEPPPAREDPVTEAIAEEPIRLEEPQPARSGRSDDERDGSLRELFWGEE